MQDDHMINVYDFDKTIYDGDSTIDFYWYCLRHHPSLVRYLPFQLWHAVLCVLGIEDRTTFKSNFFVFLPALNSLERYVDSFWNENEKNIKQWYREKDHASDVIISASPEFLLLPVAKSLKAYKLIGTRIDMTTGRIVGKNCRKKEKVTRLLKELPSVEVEQAYSDHLSDMPLFELAKHAYIVKGNIVMPLEKYLKMSGIRRRFLP